MAESVLPPLPDWLTVPSNLNALGAMWPRGAVRDDQGVLCVGGCSVVELAQRFGTPLLVLDETDFRARAKAWVEAFSGWDVYYAGKAFLSKAVARWVDEEGLGLDVCSGNELATALAVGFPASRIGFHGNNKSLDELRQAVEAGVGRIVVDCDEEISRLSAIASDLGKHVRVLVRVTTGVDAHTHEYIATAGADQKFGFSLTNERALAALVACHETPGLALAGVHSHIGSQIFDTAGFSVAAQRTMDLLAAFRDATGVELEELDLGGGAGIAYTPADTPVAVEDFHAGLAAIVEENRTRLGLGALRLSIEPGRAIVGPAGVAVYTVGVVKPQVLEDGSTRVYVSVDGGMSDNIRPALYHADYTGVLANRHSDAVPMAVRVVGKHCESGDILVHDGYLPSDTRPGDVLALAACGAYTRSMASNYNMATKVPVVAVGEGTPRAIMRRETLDDLLRLDLG
ncbi:MAG: diaminopimelate decarboxylase [Propionibacteriaceae bacterium]|nr:diaminopimelate decarboxylase [Propionibacteriaceae bacterium]